MFPLLPVLIVPDGATPRANDDFCITLLPDRNTQSVPLLINGICIVGDKSVQDATVSTGVDAGGNAAVIADSVPVIAYIAEGEPPLNPEDDNLDACIILSPLRE